MIEWNLKKFFESQFSENLGALQKNKKHKCLTPIDTGNKAYFTSLHYLLKNPSDVVTDKNIVSINLSCTRYINLAYVLRLNTDILIAVVRKQPSPMLVQAFVAPG